MRVFLLVLNVRLPNEKLHALDSDQDAILLLRAIGEMKQKTIRLRDYRAHLMADAVCYELDDEQVLIITILLLFLWVFCKLFAISYLLILFQSGSGTLKLSGYIRGQALNVNGLVHLPGTGDFQMKQIDAPTDPYPLQTRDRKSNVSMQKLVCTRTCYWLIWLCQITTYKVTSCVCMCLDCRKARHFVLRSSGLYLCAHM